MNVLLPLALAISGAKAWGTVGHETVAYLAQRFVATETKTWAQGILNDTSTSYLANVATWADSFRNTKAGAYSAPLHYIDAEDNPPDTCNVNFSRDCGSDACVVGAIANYTQRVSASPNGDKYQYTDALRFIIHFVGDVAQPLHDEAIDKGGNNIAVMFQGSSTNLHHVWDTSIVDLLANTSDSSSSLVGASKWADMLEKEIRSGKFESEAADWLEGLDITDAQGTALSWASDANKLNCEVVFTGEPDSMTNTELYPGYYEKAAPAVELQIAKAGYRLAAWLDAIVKQKAAKAYPVRMGMSKLHV
ncbi:S1/P1 nuclease [Piedraia hortae CBS 480.64]|uniref:S1/P1 nuclease n=1 Tax=Piedraia hortae CBS 480.64 TaxID=1314780 RepID=A0A6A7BSB4_9PEZI|nr:S1/P1 nuclease [Piedraia hortae CBS 480.64]